MCARVRAQRGKNVVRIFLELAQDSLVGIIQKFHGCLHESVVRKFSAQIFRVRCRWVRARAPPLTAVVRRALLTSTATESSTATSR